MAYTYDELVALQIEIEKETTLKTQEHYNKLFNEAKESENLSVTQPVQKLIKKALLPYQEAISKYLEKYQTGKVIRYSIAAKKILELLDQLSIQELTYIAIKMIMNSLYHQVNRQKVAERISEALQNEVKLKYFKEINSNYYDAVLAELTKRNARVDWKCSALSVSFHKKFEADFQKFTPREIYHVGLILLELFKQSTGFIEYQKIYEKGKIKYYVTTTPDTLTWIEKANKTLEVLNPFFLPMVCPPKEWTSVYSGGYISPYLVKNKFIKNHNRDYLKHVDTLDMPEVYSAVNTIQATPWKINQKVLDTVLLLWDRDMSIGGLPQRENIEPPPFPYPDLDKSARTEEQNRVIRIWKNEAVAAYKQNIQSRSIRLLTAQIIQLAKRFSVYENIWYPYQLDFRGRMYPIPALLQPQGNDLAKGLLMFGKGEKLGTDDAVRWLMIHGANNFGVDKVSYDDRVKWVQENEQEILEYAKNPIENQGWAEADKPFQFLAFCFEYDNYKKNGLDAVTHLPIYVDGTCNGLQHYSALLRDEVAGQAVNLLDAEKPNDIYAKVAEKLEEKLNELIQRNNTSLCTNDSVSNNSSGLNSIAMSKAWLDLGINRKLTKRPVMVLPYGGTKLSCREYIEEYMLDNYHPNFLFEHFNYIGKDPHTTVFRASRWLSNYLWEAIGDTLKSAIVGMSYIRQKLKGHKEKPIEWTTPCGLLVHQAYENTTRHRIKTELYGTISKYWVLLPDDSGLLSKQKQTNGICPNFIHSLDASCLMKYINKAKAQGIESFGAVHDSYGTLACHTATTQKLLREAFVEVYSNPKDVLETFIEAVTGETPDDLPEKGNLDINDVLISQYFFN